MYDVMRERPALPPPPPPPLEYHLHRTHVAWCTVDNRWRGHCTAASNRLSKSSLLLPLMESCVITYIMLFVACLSLTSLCHSNGHISRPCQPEKLIPLLPWPGFDASSSGHNDRRAIISEWTRRPLSHRAGNIHHVHRGKLDNITYVLPCLLWGTESVRPLNF